MTFYLSVVVNIIICSFFLFPIGVTFLPAGLNTKIFLALIGILLLFRDINRSFDLPKYLFQILAAGTVFSFVGHFAVLYNETSDYSYANYVISMLVWLSSGYVLISSTVQVHGTASFRLIISYLAAVCILQGVLALVIDNYLPLKTLVDIYVIQVAAETDFLNKVDRLYGIGAALDPAGVRFATVLILLAVVFQNDEEASTQRVVFYALSFFLITVLGNLISRTTTTGAIFGLVYLFFFSGVSTLNIKSRILHNNLIFIGVSVFVFVSGYVVYSTMDDMRELIRYGFEAFFNGFEKGEFTTDSTEKLNTMWVFPDNLKTWIIGDGLFAAPGGRGHYMNTDIGYLRFIFYNGTLGLLCFSLFLVYVVNALVRLYPAYRIGFYMLLFLGFIIWIKVSTDLFQFYALFLAAAFYPTHKTKLKIEES